MAAKKKATGRKKAAGRSTGKKATRKKATKKKATKKKATKKKATKKKATGKKPVKKKAAKKKPAVKKAARKVKRAVKKLARKPAVRQVKRAVRKVGKKIEKATRKPAARRAGKKLEQAKRKVRQAVRRTPLIGGRRFERALALGRPPTVRRLFPNSRALIVGGKYIDRAMLRRGQAIALAANARNSFVIRGVLQAAQRARAAVIIEIARSEGGTGAYCAVNLWNLARQVDAVANELGITVPVAVHADHYGIKKWSDVAVARLEIPSLFEQGVTSIAIDASHLREDENVLANLELAPLVPSWAGLETEVGEIKGSQGLSTREDALYHIRALNAHGVFADWIALNNGTTHGIQASDQGIQVELTAEIHAALEPYRVSGAQHGTSGNNTERLRQIARRTRTTKANVATALQMLSWGLEVNDYGNAQLDEQGRFIKVPGEGVSEEMWARMVAYAEQQGWQGGSYKKLNLPFENLLLAQPQPVRQRMAKRVENFCYRLMTEVFNSADTAELVIEEILERGSHDAGPKVERLEDPAEWTEPKLREKARALGGDRGPSGDYDD